MTPPNKTPQETAARIIELNAQGLPRAEIGRRCGVSRSTLYRILRGHGETLDGYDRRDPDTDRRVAELYPAHSRSEIAAALGVPHARVQRIKNRLGLRHTPETDRRLQAKQEEARRRGRRSPEAAANKSEARRRLIRSEMRRLLGGDRQRTRLRLTIMPPRMRRALCRLQREYGYFYPTDSIVVYYDRHTRRRLNVRCDEAYYAERYGVTFLPLIE